nr:5-formyltetrahydrofolate cyclo-ligase [Companilactobacillus versmoldensis]
MDKKDLRKLQTKALSKGRAKTTEEGNVLLEKLAQEPEWQNAQSIATTVSNLFEVPTKPIIERALSEGKQVYLPKTMPHRQMAFLPFSSYDDLVVSAYGIPEPVYQADLVERQPDLVLVPGVAFSTSDRYRVGFGGGYYDRFLAQYQGKTVALVPSIMEFADSDWPVEEFDMQIDKLITLD